jgi:hypothetical protein
MLGVQSLDEQPEDETEADKFIVEALCDDSQEQFVDVA